MVEMKRLCRKFLWFLCAVCILAGIAARFLFLDISYEYDEIFTAVSSNPSLSFSWILTNWLLPDVHPPLHNFLLYIYNHFVPYGPEIWLRLPSVIFGFAALGWAWFGFPMRFGKTARGLFFAMMSCQMYGVFYTQYARAYALVLFLSVPLTFLFLNISHAVIKNHKITLRQWLAYGVLSLLLCWSHYFGALLFGVFSVLLFAEAFLYKRRLMPFIAVPALVFVLFLPWLGPNLWENIFLQRFNGTWWAGKVPPIHIMPELIVFFFSSFWSHFILMILLLAGLWVGMKQYRRNNCFAYGRDIVLLTFVLLFALGIVGLLYIKIYLFFGRYFMPFVPSVYLLCVLIMAPVIRRYIGALALFVAAMAINLGMIGVMFGVMHFTGFLSARPSAQMYRTLWPDKELFVIALEAFPPTSMNAMYGFYPNEVWHMNARVTELYHLDEAAREKELAEREKAVILMPNCTSSRLNRLSKEWERAIAVEMQEGNSCFLKLTDKGVFAPPADWQRLNEEQLQKIGSV